MRTPTPAIELRRSSTPSRSSLTAWRPSGRSARATRSSPPSRTSARQDPSLVHAFSSMTEFNVDTPFDGRSVRAAIALCVAADSESTDSGLALTSPCSASLKRHLRPPMPSSIHVTREANRTSQLCRSFPPLACVSRFVCGLYASSLTCAVRHVEIKLTPPSEGTEEARAVQKVLADANSPRTIAS